MATTKEELLVLGIKASGYYLRQVAVTCRRGTSVVRDLKFLTPFSVFLTIKPFNHHYIKYIRALSGVLSRDFIKL